ncbi:MBL fold metallo-hydrolase [Halomonas sp. M20]|uniref:MBL fold metallo-hydrolase n=1 Tax=Halomonas sp. M20 TaxID=2763264 RepID=UPI001D0BC0B4|nr:MBL fold metallo-hydrolase [Halomonas sp. M20]
MRLLPLLAAGLTLAFTSTVGAQQIESVEVRGPIHMLTGEGGNVGVLIGDDGTFMIDDKFAPLTDAILAEIDSLGGSPPTFLINTHFHGDHTGGNENLGKTGSTIVAHERVRQRLAEGSEIKAFDMTMAPQSGAALPVITFSRDISFHLNGEDIDIEHVPDAHTDSDSIVYFRDTNVIHTGDTVFNGFFPFIDTAHGGTLKGMIAATERVLALADDDTRIIPGHGPLASKQDVQTYRDMLTTVQQRLGKLKSKGLSAEEAVAEQPLADLEEEWGDGTFTADRWIEIIYDGV